MRSKKAHAPAFFSTLLILCCVHRAVSAEEGSSAKQLAFFETRIRPLLANNCYECHSVATGKSKGHLRVDSRAALLSGGESGPALVAGDAEKSLLIRAVGYKDENTQMPPKGKLPQPLIDDLTQWVKNGAPWPQENAPALTAAPAAGKDNAGVYEKLRAEHWCWQPMKPVSAPTVQDNTWPNGTIDRFVLAMLEKNHLTPAPAASKRILLRRIFIDLTGLPPAPEDYSQFLKDNSPDALESIVDRLLASPRFGERWGRHWMDVVRYADSAGLGANMTFNNAWRYRDYVISAFNNDKPYDQFLREQIAGDLLPAADPSQAREQRIATAFLSLGPKELAEYDKEKLRWDVIDEQINTLGQAFMGMTLGCARCHDHKFDPIPTRDYYALAGIMNSTDTLAEKPWDGIISYWVEDLLVPGKENEKAWNNYDSAVKAAHNQLGMARVRHQELLNLESKLAEKRAGKAPQAEIAAAEAAYLKKRAEFRPAPEELKKREDELAKMKAARESKPEDVKRMTAELARLKGLPDSSEAEIARQEKAYEAAVKRPRPDRAMCVRDGKTPANVRIHIRGEAKNLGAEVPRGFLSALSGTTTMALKGSGRLELAQWLTQPEHPLTARVMVNRIWSHLFGFGLVRTVDNFGVRGETPSHPELLDYLSRHFVENGWSVKKLIREIVLSRSYQMSVSSEGSGLKADPENRLLWRQNRRRLEAESIRDAILQISGQLDLTAGGNTMLFEGRLSDPDSIVKLNADPFRRRTVYFPVYRGELPLDILEVFNFAEPGMVTGQRASTQVPTQALYLMNSPFMMEQAAQTIRRVDKFTAHDRLDCLYTSVLGRPASPSERARALAFIAASQNEADGWTQLCQALLSSNEFLFID